MLNIKALGLGNVIGFNVAVSDSNRILPLIVTDSPAHHSLNPNTVDTRYCKIIGKKLVPSMTLASIIDVVNPPKIDWIKVDTEGSEREILLETDTFKLIKIYKPRMVVECHKEGDDKAIIEALKQIGYSYIEQSFPDSLRTHNFIFCKP